MKSSIEKVSNLERKMTIQVPVEVVQNAFKKVYQNVQKDAHIKGFRPGKAPLEKVKLLYGDQVKSDVTQQLVQSNYFLALKEQQVNPISYPEFEFHNVKENEEFQFSAFFEVKPEIQLKKYEDFEVKKEKLDVSDEKVNKILENIRTSHAEIVPVLEDRAAIMGDIAIFDFNGFVDGQPLEGGQGNNHQLELGSKQFIEGFEDGLVGMKLGTEKTLQLKFPTPYHAKHLEGKPVEFKVKLNELKKKSLPELNDAFIAKIMGGNTEHTLDKMKTTIREDLLQSEKKRIDGDLKNRLLKLLVQNNPVEVPPSMHKEQKQLLVEDTKKRMTEQGLPESELEAYITKWDADLNQTANEMIQSGFIIDAIAAKQTLHCTDEDLENKMQEYAKQTGLEIAKIKDFYAKPDQNSRLSYMVTEEKVVDYVLSKSKVTEVSADDLKQ